MADLIERQRALRLCIEGDGHDDERFTEGYNFAVCEIKENLQSLPAIEAEPVRHGRWIPTEYDAYADGAPVWNKFECSECGHEHSGEEDTLTAFCPDCGALMDGGV